MKVTTYGTRGSIPISNPESIVYGGNTTCLRIESDCIPGDKCLAIDAGSGLVPLAMKLLSEGKKSLHILATHWHHDHTQGLFLAAPTFIKGIRTHIYGPQDASGIGPREMFKDMMRPPYHPVHNELHESHFSFYPFQFPQINVILVHPEGGIRTMKLVDYEKLIDKGANLPCGKGKYPQKQFLVIKMFMSNHPEATVSYRFEENPTGKVFVFLTDHENHDTNPSDLKNHLRGADLLIMDSQYTREKYDRMTAGYGHATPDYCVKTAFDCEIKWLGLTHHDPSSKDKDIEEILVFAQTHAVLEAVRRQVEPNILIFACRDYEEIEV